MILFVPLFPRKVIILVGSLLVQNFNFFVWGCFLWLNTMNFDLLHFTLMQKKKRKRTIRDNVINDPFWERTNSKGTRKNGSLCSFLSKKSKDSCESHFWSKKVKILCGVPFGWILPWILICYTRPCWERKQRKITIWHSEINYPFWH